MSTLISNDFYPPARKRRNRLQKQSGTSPTSHIRTIDMPPDTLLTARAICKEFRHRNKNTTVLSDIELTLYRGELVALIGPSGCGKSTLLNILCGLVAADSGEVCIAHALAKNIGYMQQHDSLLPWMTVLQNCIMPLRLRNPPSLFTHYSRDWKRAQEAVGLALLREIGLAEYAEHYPHQLSGGMRQKISCARAMVTEPPLLLLDEPFRSLDGIAKRDIHDWYRKRVMKRTSGISTQDDNGKNTNGRSGVTTLLVTHDIHEAAEYADRTLICNAQPMRISAILPVPERDAANRHRNEYAQQIYDAFCTCAR